MKARSFNLKPLEICMKCKLSESVMATVHHVGFVGGSGRTQMLKKNVIHTLMMDFSMEIIAFCSSEGWQIVEIVV